MASAVCRIRLSGRIVDWRDRATGRKSVEEHSGKEIDGNGSRGSGSPREFLVRQGRVWRSAVLAAIGLALVSGVGLAAGAEQCATTLSKLGLGVQTLTSDLAKQLGTGVKSGALITNVVEGSLASVDGLRMGDVIVEADQQRVGSAADLEQILGRAVNKHEVLTMLVAQSKQVLDQLCGVKVRVERIIWANLPGKAEQIWPIPPKGSLSKVYRHQPTASPCTVGFAEFGFYSCFCPLPKRDLNIEMGCRGEMRIHDVRYFKSNALH